MNVDTADGRQSAPRSFLNEPAGLLDYVAAAACQNTKTANPVNQNELLPYYGGSTMDLR
jgi:hypothetical protein